MLTGVLAKVILVGIAVSALPVLSVSPAKEYVCIDEEEVGRCSNERPRGGREGCRPSTELGLECEGGGNEGLGGCEPVCESFGGEGRRKEGAGGTCSPRRSASFSASKLL